MGEIRWNGLAMAAALVVATACGGDAGDQADVPPAQPADAPAAEAAAQVGANVELPEGVTLDMVTQGKTVFETSTCWTCHGMDAAGGALAPSLRDQDWLNSDGSFDGIVGIVREGVPQPQEHPGLMPPMGGAPLTDDQINNVAAYVYALSRGG